MTHSFTETSLISREMTFVLLLLQNYKVLCSYFFERKDENTKKFKKLMMDNCDFNIQNYHDKQDLS